MSRESKISKRPYYTAEQLHDSARRLPGFTDTADVFDIFENPLEQTLWQPVLSATIVTRLNGILHILTGNRTSDGNATHPNVASTPTIRVPYPDARFLMNDHVQFNLQGAINPLRPFVSETLGPSVTFIPDNSDVLGFKVDHLLSAKLGLGPTLETTQKKVGRASLARCVVGFSYLQDDETNEPVYEPLIMFGAVVGLKPSAAAQIPHETPSYNHLGWVPLERYSYGVATKNLLDVLPSASPINELEVCVRGLCNATSMAIVSNEKDIQRHLTEEGILKPF